MTDSHELDDLLGDDSRALMAAAANSKRIPSRPMSVNNINTMAAAGAYATSSSLSPGAPRTIIPRKWSDECKQWFKRAKRLNTLCFLVHLASAVVTYVLAATRSSLQISLVLEQISTDGDLHRASEYHASHWAVPVLWLVPVYFSVSAVAHFFLHLKRDKLWEEWVKNHENPVRWIEYSFSAGIMMICIALLSGFQTYGGLLLLFVANVCCMSFGWVMEEMRALGSNTWLPFLLGSMPAIASWVAIGIPFFASVSHIPRFVLGIYFSVFIAFNIFPVIMVYQFSGIRTTERYIQGECAYMIASLVAKSLLGWQVVGGTLST